MTVEISKELMVQVHEDVNIIKLTTRQQALRAAIQRGETKCLGVSQVMLGLMVMSYSIPLHITEATDVVTFGVPWWTGLTFIAAGVIIAILEKHCTMKTMQFCFMVSVLSVVVSLVAVIIYSVDLDKNKDMSCVMELDTSCGMNKYTKLSRCLKASLLIFTLAQTVVSAVVCFLLIRLRHYFQQYSSISQAAEPVTS
uniref:Transmembrane protein 176 n=1 Tax=Iconisemion striatum TaxID=60296 RepID=A0A1A7YMK4_9TELE